MKKRRHHYVWRKYLRSWSLDESIWCARQGKIFKADLMNVGQIRDFYKLKELSAQDIEFIRMVAIEQSADHLQELNEGWLNWFNFIFDIKKYIESINIISNKIDDLLDEAIFNFEEELHSKIEFDAIEFIELLLNEDASFFERDNDCSKFIYYICVQYMRTQKIKVNALGSSHDLHLSDVVEKTWNVISHILATNLGYSIYSERNSFRIVFLKNLTSITLITGDQPIINTYAIGLSLDKDVEGLDFYYPLSPNLAILLTQDHSHSSALAKICLSEKEVDRYNQSIIEQSHSQIYAASEESLARYVVNK
ncbi:hypothetical protein B9G53_04965 [Pseudanabaena sp. SR411]|uniref:DUF4238 domain-containing protein n=1 Tax=Pseudanabaena sp. SR411 TaxID=1980935 RepID=UPI000B99A8F3|nr:DUF4238 domain-containing protein [Pseudanabaena sp. SR411]OYQ66177.1 hypothetical protein B9G53_04965 [Pseudanabaena sp. SR411]